MAKKNYATTVMRPEGSASTSLQIGAKITGVCRVCAHYHDEENDPKAGPHGECRLNPPHHVSEYLTRRGAIRRYALVLATTPSCGGYRPR